MSDVARIALHAKRARSTWRWRSNVATLDQQRAVVLRAACAAIADERSTCGSPTFGGHVTHARPVSGQTGQRRSSWWSWLPWVVSLAACGGDDDHHKTTVALPPTAPVMTFADAGQPQAGTGAPAERCQIDESYLADRKACTVDADCVSLGYRPTCCASTRTVGVSKNRFDEVSACAAKIPPPSCVCDGEPNRAEDGRALLGGVSTRTRCLAGRCQTSVTERPCGSKITCKSDEVCVSYGDALSGGTPEDASTGDNAYEVFACLPNPCLGELSCDCAQAVCDVASAGRRTCEIARNDKSDVACVPHGD